VRFFCVTGDVVLAGFCCMMLRVRRMAVGRMSMMRSRFAAAFFVMFRGFAVMLGGMLMMFGRAMMVVGGRMRMVHFVLFHGWATK
jgi:hypothetical protein